LRASLRNHEEGNVMARREGWADVVELVVSRAPSGDYMITSDEPLSLFIAAETLEEALRRVPAELRAAGVSNIEDDRQ
jgi:hypothetical protein